MLKKLNDTVKRETGYIAIWVILLSALMQAVFLISGIWNYTVLLGNLLSGSVAVANFLLMGFTVQNAVEKDEKDARNLMKVSQSLRTLMLFVAVALGVLLPFFDIWASIIPLFFPRVAIAFRPYFNQK